MKKFLSLATFVCLVGIASLPSVRAASITVNTTLDEVNGNTSSIANLIATPGGAGISLREAIIAANNTPGANIITVPAGTYTLTRVGNDANCQNGDLDINGNLAINGAGPATTIVQGATDASFTGSIGDKIFGINQDGTFTSLTVSLSGMTIRYGRNTVPNGDPTFAFTGAGIDVFFTGTGNSTTISNCVITGNENVNAHGGGINVDSGNSGLPGDPAINTVNRGTVTIVDCVIANNKSKTDGAGINLYSDIHNVVITNCVVTNNVTSTSGNGGGIQIRHSYGGTVSVLNCNVSSNSCSGVGGGIFLGGNQHANLSNTTISNNVCTAATAFGGGLEIAGLGAAGFTAILGVTNCTIVNNHADNGTSAAGGGVYFSGAYSATLSGCTIRGNTADYGAGVANGGVNPGVSLTMISCSVSNNTASASGGGVASLATASTTTLNKGSIVANTAATSGGGIYCGDGVLSGGFNRIAGNTAPSGRGAIRVAGTTTLTNNWWGTNSPAALMSGTVGFTPWLQLAHTANPGSIVFPNTTTLTASFLTNSAGTAILAANLGALAGVPVTFNNAVHGTLSGAQAAIQSSAIANATFTPNAAGAGSADAIVDGQIVTAPITIQASVSSINRIQATPTNASSVQWTVTFSAALSGGAAGNFSLVNGGLGGTPTITSVTPVGGVPATSWTVAASTGSGSGTLGLNMVNASGLSAGLANLPFTGQVYTMDLIAPTLTCSTNIIVTANGYCPVPVSFSVSASDNFALAVATTNPPSGSSFAVGTNTVTLGARDTAGNTNFCTFKVIVLAGAPPLLSVLHSGTNAILCWSNVFPCYALQYTPRLLSPPSSNVWTVHPGAVVPSGGNLYVTNPVTTTNRFFRLAH